MVRTGTVHELEEFSAVHSTGVPATDIAKGSAFPLRREPRGDWRAPCDRANARILILGDGAGPRKRNRVCHPRHATGGFDEW